MKITNLQRGYRLLQAFKYECNRLQYLCQGTELGSALCPPQHPSLKADKDQLPFK